MDALATIASFWPTLTAVASLALAVVSAVHALLNKRDPRAASGWVGLIVLAPFVGALLYFLLGVNRINRRAATLMRGKRAQARALAAPVDPIDPGAVTSACGTRNPHLSALARANDTLTRRPLLGSNRIEPLEDGDAAYPAMLAAIEEARHSIALSTYIFDLDPAGERFASALGRAVARGVPARVLIDAVGARYSFPSIVGRLRREGVQVALFLPTWKAPLATPFINLRNHRKILVVDGGIAFTGGMNLRHGHWLSERPAHPVRDLHFRVEGPVVAQLLDCFAEDWAFAAGESLSGTALYSSTAPDQAAPGASLSRVITDGPDDDFDLLRHAILAALACAQRSVRVVTPYFVPDASLITGLNVAALRGVAVDVVIPARGNIRLVQWATTALLWQVLKHGCRVHLSPEPFDHSKLLVVDEAWSLIGSANWDARSLRLNFELNVEVYDASLAARLGALIDARIARSRSVTLADVDGRSLPVRVRDGAAKLLSPYL